MLLNLMVHKADVERATTNAATSFSSAGAKTWTVLHSQIACMIQPMSARERAQFSREQQEISHTMYLAKSYDIVNGDRIVYGGTYYNVVGIRNVVNLDRLWTINLMELTNVTAV